MTEAIVLFAHGSREPEWAQPFERIAGELARKLPACEVKLAYLELMRPSLDEALAELIAAKVERIRVVPLFLGLGGHVKKDLPKLIANANPGVELVLEPPIGEQPQLLQAIAAAIAEGSRAPRRSARRP